MRRFIKKEDLYELVEILSERFPTANISIDHGKVGRFASYGVNVVWSKKHSGKHYDQNLTDCLMLLRWTYGNVGFSMC